jgi:hypothetical protein
MHRRQTLKVLAGFRSVFAMCSNWPYRGSSPLEPRGCDRARQVGSRTKGGAVLDR